MREGGKNGKPGAKGHAMLKNADNFPVYEVDGCNTSPKLFLRKSLERGERIAMREKDLGIWQSYTWNEFRERALWIASGLRCLGLQNGDVATILSEDCKEWVWVDMGIMLAGGVVCGIYPTSQPEQVEFYLTDNGTRVLFVEDEEQLDKYLEIRGKLPESLISVYYFESDGLRDLKEPNVYPIESLYELGRESMERQWTELEENIVAGRPEDPAVIVYTSGTTGLPKGAVIPHRTLMFHMTAAPDFLPYTPDDELLTYLPLCHLAERLFSLTLPLATGAVVNLVESPSSIEENLREVSPTIIFGVPRVWEKAHSRIVTTMSEASSIGNYFYRMGLSIGYRRADALMAGKSVPLLTRILFGLVDLLIYKNIKQLLGFQKAKFLVSGAAPISADLLRWYLALGLPIAELYGQTETGIATITRLFEVKPGTVGYPLPGVDLQFEDNGEILIRSDGQFTGYLNEPMHTAETIVGGWIKTGDVGMLDDSGGLVITGRIKDIIITAGGKNITPSLIENELKYSPYISDGVVVGDKKPYLTALIMLDKEVVEHYAQTHGIPFTDYRSLCSQEEVVALVESEIQRINQKFSRVEQIKDFKLIDILLTAEDEELTPTMKLKRNVINRKYEHLINSMYRAQ